MAKKKDELAPKLEGKKLEEQTADKVIETLTKQYASSLSFRGGETVEDHKKGALSTGLFSLDRAIGIWGLPWERVIEIYGPHMSGKSSLALKAISQAQLIYPEAIISYIDLEHTLDLNMATNTGVDINNPNFLVNEPDTAEEAIDIIRTILRQRQRAIIVVDSVTAMVPKEELDKPLTAEERVGGAGKLMSRSVKHIVNDLKGSNCMVIFINQIRHKIGKMGFGGPTTTTSGGEALPFYASLRLNVRKYQQITKDELIVGHKANIKIEKNKVGPPLKEVVVDVYYGSGFCSVTNILDMAIASNIIVQSGAWYSFLDKNYQGLYNLVEAVLSDTEMYKLIRDAILRLYDAPNLHPEMYVDKQIIYGKPDDIIKVEDAETFLNQSQSEESNDNTQEHDQLGGDE